MDETLNRHLSFQKDFNNIFLGFLKNITRIA